MFRQRILIAHMIKRFKTNTKNQYPHELKKKSNTQKALVHFDDFYKAVYGERWPGIRAALLTEHKYVALINNFCDREHTKEQLEQNGAINIRLIYERYSDELFGTEPTASSRSGDKTKTRKLDEKVAGLLQTKQADDIRSLYNEHSEEVLAQLQTEKNADKSRIIDAESVANLRKSMADTVEEVDYNRMVSAEIGAIGLHEFIPATKLKGMEDFVTETEHYQYYSSTVDFPLTIVPDTEFKFPAELDLYVYAEGDISRFNRPRRGTTGTFSHFLMDGASILPALMLNVQPGDRVFDACAAPGGKSLLILQTLLPEIVVCNDIMENRVNRIYSLFEQYLNDFNNKWDGKRCIVQRSDARMCTDIASYDKILVDVPCTSDRHSVIQDDNNMFKSTRIKERLKLPEAQASILTHCLELLKPGGSLIYSTCSLSPVQNDGVVHMALSKAFTELHITVTIKDLTPALKPLQSIFRFENPSELKYGQLVLPYLPANYGPMYFCKLTRNGSEN